MRGGPLSERPLKGGASRAAAKLPREGITSLMIFVARFHVEKYFPRKEGSSPVWWAVVYDRWNL
jgi:hypothetical protein